MRSAQTVLAVLAAAATVTSVAVAGPAATTQRVVIDMKIIPKSTFALIPQQPGALARDTGTLGGTWKSIPGREVMRDGQEVTIYNGVVWTLIGKLGTLTIRERNEWVSVGNNDDVAIGTWKVVRGTGQYAGIVGKGRSGHAGLGSPWYARYEGFLTSP